MDENCFQTIYKNAKKRFKIFVGSSCKALGKSICDELDIQPGKINLDCFLNGEIRVEIMESVRGLDVFLIQSTSDHTNDNFFELLFMINCCKFSSASRITAVIPFFPYSRHEKKQSIGDPITAKLLADLLTIAGADHVITMDLHSCQIQGYFQIPVDNLWTQPLLVNWICQNVTDYKKAILISPHDGGVKRVAAMADILQMEFSFIHKKRNNITNTKNSIIPANVSNRNAIIVDDMADTCRTVLKATEKLKKAGANKIYVICVHGVFSGDAIEKISKSEIESFVVTNTIDNTKKLLNVKNIHIIDVGPTLAEAFRRDENCESVSYLFKNVYKSKN